MDSRAVLVRITGRVQGVSFRVWTRKQAEKLGLSGWVRNERDGSVAALVVGTEAAVSEMLGLLWEGPRGAAVSSVVSEPAHPDDLPSGFEITG